ncbi:MAG: radical SAM protein [Clostridia bacterium]|nr:radical SAM protein [Clostridia bacterium]
MKSEARAAVFVPHLGCPNDCVFCNQRAIAGVTSPATPEDVHLAAERVRSAGAQNAEIAFFGGSFTAIERGYMRSLLAAASEELKKGGFSGIRLSTRPDCVDDEVLDELKAAGVTVIELGAQSMRDAVLEKSGRGHTADDTRRASALIKAHGIRLGLQMMTGLPGDDDEGALYTANELVKLEPECVRIYPTVVLKNTALSRMHERGEYVPQTVGEAVALCVKLVRVFDAAGVKVIRLGLQRTESCESDVVAGAWHPAFGELIYGELKYEDMRRRFCESQPEKGEVYAVSCGKENVSVYVGQKRGNFLRLEAEFGIKMKTDLSGAYPEGSIRKL